MNGISVAELMKSIGLTTGGFYKQFPSKEALVAEAAQAAFGDLDLLLASFDTAHGDHDTARGALVDFYLSAEHRDQPGTGCPTAGFAGDMAREPTAGAVRETYAGGVEEFAAWLSADTNDGLPMVATLVGAILLARATAGTELSERILESTHKALTASQGLDPES
ncbi:TetR family transcriptional regulator [Streptomyces sp. QTS52]